MHAQTAMSIFRSPFRTWSAEEILEHFQIRTSVKYFSVADEAETSRTKIDQILTNEFQFNQETYQLPADFDWQRNPSTDIEWMIMWHKFYYAVGLGMAYQETSDNRYATKWIELISPFIDRVPYDFLSSDVTGRRIQNWIFSYPYFVGSVPPDFNLKFLHSIYEQVTFLLSNLTEARNHRTLELYSIFLAAVIFPEFKGADEWLEFSNTELLKNMQSDLLSDGVQCELSTDYHHIVLRNYLNVRKLAALNNIPMPAEMDSLIKMALEFSLYMHKPDGFIPSLSDGDTADFSYLLQQGHELFGDEQMLFVATKGQQGKAPAHRSKAFDTSGYYILRSGWGETEPYEDERYFVFDCGALGAGNHGHLDCLNFEMAAYGQSLIVDPGRYTYDESGETNWRALFRGTSFHNIVLVDGRNQTRYEFHKRKFKIKGEAPQHELKSFISSEGFDFLHGIARSHEYPVTHERKIFFAAGEYWIVTDLLLAEEPHEYDLLFHLSDKAFNAVSVTAKQNTLLIDSPNLIIAHAANKEIYPNINSGYVSPTYGVKLAAPIVNLKTKAANACYNTILYPYKSERPKIRIENIPVYVNEKLCRATQASAMRITFTLEQNSFIDDYFVAHENNSYRFGSTDFTGSFLWSRKDTQGNLVRNFSA